MQFVNDSELCIGGDFVIDFTDEDTAKIWSRSPNEILLVLVGVPLIIAVGVPGNLAFLFTLYRVSEMRTVTNFYLANLAVADLLYIIIFSALSTSAYLIAPDVTNTYAVTSWLGCAAVILSLDVVYFGSNLMVSLVAFERFYAICHPLKSRQTRSPRRAVVMVIIFWVLSITCSFATVSRFSRFSVACVLWPDNEDHDSRPSTVNFCSAETTWVAFVAKCMYFGIWTFGLSVNSFLYYRIVRRLGLRTFASSAESQQQTHKRKAIRRQVARMLIINSIAFFLLQSPFIIILNLLSIIKAATGIAVIRLGNVTDLWPIAVFLSLCNSAVNPLIYNITNARYRQAFKEAIGCSTNNRSQSPSNTATVSSRVKDQSESKPDISENKL